MNSMRSNVRHAAVLRQFTENADGSIQFDISGELSCRFEPEPQILWSRMTPVGIPCFTPGLLRDMERASQIVESYFSASVADDSLGYIVLTSGVPRAFNLGGDFGGFLQHIATQDRTALSDYARTAINVIYRNYVCHNLRGVTTVALLEGDALGGGFECALSCDVVIAERHVKCGFPEVLFDMFPGMGALSFLSRRCSRAVVQEVTRSGRQFTADELLAMGVIDLVVDTGGGADAVRNLVQRRRGQRHGHQAMNAVDRMLRPVTLQELYDVVALWVSAAISLPIRGQDWMRRVHSQQLRAFGLVTDSPSAVVRPISAASG